MLGDWNIIELFSDPSISGIVSILYLILLDYFGWTGYLTVDVSSSSIRGGISTGSSKGLS